MRRRERTKEVPFVVRRAEDSAPHLEGRAVVTPLLRGRFQGRRTSNRARVYRPAKRRNYRPPKSTFSHRPNFVPCGREGWIRATRREQTVVPGCRPRMTTGGQSAQSLVLSPSKALPMGTMKSTSSHRLMGMRCDPGPAIFGLTCERERFMPIRGMSRCVCSRNDDGIPPLVFDQAIGLVRATPSSSLLSGDSRAFAPERDAAPRSRWAQIRFCS